MHMKKNKGITLIALIITIIILLILAGISLAEFTGHGLFARAIEAREKTEIARLEEEMRLAIIETTTNKGGNVITMEDYIKTLEEKEDLNITDIYEDNGKQIITIDDKYVFEIIDDDGKIKVENIGTKDNLAPKITLTSITNTTSTITVEVTTKRNEGGKIEYYIKGENDTDYELKETKTEETYTYSGLEQNKKYNIKIVAVAENKETAEILVDRTTGNVPDLTTANVTFTYSPAQGTWTNGSVTVTASTTVEGYTLQTSKDGKTWTSTASQTFTENGTIYAVLYDGTNYGGIASGNVTNIDKTKPTIGSATGSTATGNTGTITVSSVADTGGSGLKGYYISTSSTAPTETSVTWTSSTASNFTKTVTTNGTYYVWVLDNAGNVSAVKSCTVSGIVSKVSITAYNNLTIVAGNTGTPTLTYTGTPKSKTFSSSNTSVATINSNTGVVTGVAAGTATMTVKLTNYDGTTVSATCTVTVKTLTYTDNGNTSTYGNIGGWTYSNRKS